MLEVLGYQSTSAFGYEQTIYLHSGMHRSMGPRSTESESENKTLSEGTRIHESTIHGSRSPRSTKSYAPKRHPTNGNITKDKQNRTPLKCLPALLDPGPRVSLPLSLSLSLSLSLALYVCLSPTLFSSSLFLSSSLSPRGEGWGHGHETHQGLKRNSYDSFGGLKGNSFETQ